MLHAGSCRRPRGPGAARAGHRERFAVVVPESPDRSARDPGRRAGRRDHARGLPLHGLGGAAVPLRPGAVALVPAGAHARRRALPGAALGAAAGRRALRGQRPTTFVDLVAGDPVAFVRVSMQNGLGRPTVARWSAGLCWSGGSLRRDGARFPASRGRPRPRDPASTGSRARGSIRAPGTPSATGRCCAAGACCSWRRRPRACACVRRRPTRRCARRQASSACTSTTSCSAPTRAHTSTCGCRSSPSTPPRRRSPRYAPPTTAPTAAPFCARGGRAWPARSTSSCPSAGSTTPSTRASCTSWWRAISSPTTSGCRPSTSCATTPSGCATPR